MQQSYCDFIINYYNNAMKYQIESQSYHLNDTYHLAIPKEIQIVKL